MTCESVGSVRLIFPEEGFEIEPLEVDVRKKQNDVNTMGKFELTESDARFIEDYANEATPIVLAFDRWPAHRFYYPEKGAINYKRGVDGITHAELTLPDSAHVLDRGAIEKSWDQVTLQDAVEYIIENRDDPEGVLNDDVIFTAGNQSELRVAYLERDIPVVGGFAQDLVGSGLGVLDNLGDYGFDENATFTGFDFSGVPPLEALVEVLSEFRIGFTVRTNGQLIIGPTGSFGRTFINADGDDGLKINRYDVTESASITDTVLMRSGYTIDGQQASVSDSVYLGRSRVQAHAQATTSQLSGTSDSFGLSNVNSLQQLENISIWGLLDEISKDINGSLVLNGSASTDNQALSALDVGDWMYVDPAIENKCRRNEGILTGTFLITDVHHNIGSTRGWRTTLQLSRIVYPSSIETQSFLYDPSTGQKFESLQAYNEYRQRQLEEDQETVEEETGRDAQQGDPGSWVEFG